MPRFLPRFLRGRKRSIASERIQSGSALLRLSRGHRAGSFESEDSCSTFCKLLRCTLLNFVLSVTFVVKEFCCSPDSATALDDSARLAIIEAGARHSPDSSDCTAEAQRTQSGKLYIETCSKLPLTSCSP